MKTISSVVGAEAGGWVHPVKTWYFLVKGSLEVGREEKFLWHEVSCRVVAVFGHTHCKLSFCLLDHALSQSTTNSLAHSLAHLQTHSSHSLSRSRALSLSWELAPRLPLTQSLCDSRARTHTHTRTHGRTRTQLCALLASVSFFMLLIEVACCA